MGSETTYFKANEFFRNNGSSSKLRFGEHGFLSYPPHNLIPWSSNFVDGSWQKYGLAPVANAALSPSGQMDATKLVPLAGPYLGYRGWRSFYFVGEVARGSMSVYAKAGEISEIYLQDYMVFFDLRKSFQTMGFDLLTGQMFDPAHAPPVGRGKASMQDIGNGWYRCAIESQDGGDFTLGPCVNHDLVFDGDGTSGVYIWGAQMTRGPLSDYVATEGNTRSELAIEYDPLTGECLGVLNEPERTNWVRWSRQFAHRGWRPFGLSVVVTPNKVLAPNGFLEGDLIEDIKVHPRTDHVLYQYMNATPIPKGVMSIYVKAGTRSQIVLNDDMGNTVAGFDLKTGEIFKPIHYVTDPSDQDWWTLTDMNTDAVMQDVGRGWFRCSIPVKNCVMFTFYLAKNKVTNYPTDEQEGGDIGGLYVWGAQMEPSEETVPTSYITTGGVGRTRAADQILFTPDQINYGVRTSERRIEPPRLKIDDDMAARQLVPGAFPPGHAARVGAEATAIGDPDEPEGSWWVEWSARRVVNNARLIGYTTDDASPVGQSFDSMKVYDETVLEHPVPPVAGELYRTASAFGPATATGGNIIQWSTDLTKVPPWIHFEVTAAAAAGLAPNGLNEAFKVTDNAANSFHTIMQYPSYVKGRLSVHAKAAELSQICLQNLRSYCFDLLTGTMFELNDPGSPSWPAFEPQIEALADGWYRCSILGDGVDGWFCALLKNGIRLRAGTGEGLLLWGPQWTEDTGDVPYEPTTVITSERAITMNGAKVAKDVGSTAALAAPGTHIFLGNGGSVPINGHIRRVYYVPRRQPDDELRGNTAPFVPSDLAPTPIKKDLRKPTRRPSRMRAR